MGFFSKLKRWGRKAIGPLSVGALAIPGVGGFISKGLEGLGGLLGDARAQSANAGQTANHATGALVRGAATGYIDGRANYVRPDGVTNADHAASELPKYIGLGALAVGAFYLLRDGKRRR